jgi:hypothetical protein
MTCDFTLYIPADDCLAVQVVLKKDKEKAHQQYKEGDLRTKYTNISSSKNSSWTMYDVKTLSYTSEGSPVLLSVSKLS